MSSHAQVLAAMLARLSSPDYPALHGLTVRTTDDPAIALLDAWAMVDDLLSFHNRRIADEGYLRTAQDFDSLRRLGRLVGYQPRPAIAAGTYLAYTVDRDAAGRDLELTVPQGSRAQSVPAPGEDPQSFETSEDLLARATWSLLPVRRRRPPAFRLDPDHGPLDSSGGPLAELPIAGTAANLQVNDRLLISAGTARHLVTVTSVRIDSGLGITVLGLDVPPVSDTALATAIRALAAVALDDPMYDRSRIAQRYVDAALTPLAARAGGISDPARLAAELAVAQDRLAEGAGAAALYPNVRDWFASQRAALELLHRRAEQLVAQQEVRVRPAAPALRERRSDQPAPENPALAGLGELLAALRRPPSRLPASPRQLARTPDQLYGSGSDVVARLLLALDPRLRSALYPAWSGVDLAGPGDFSALEVLRVTAMPFGATAPLQTVKDGKPITPVDWDLPPQPATHTLTAMLTIGANGMPTAGALTWVTLGADAASAILDLSGGETVQLGPGQVTSTIFPPDEGGGGPGLAEAADPPDPPAHDPGVQLLFDPALPELTVFFNQVTVSAEATITDRQGNQVTLSPGQARAGLGGWQLELIESATESQQFVVLTIRSLNLIDLDAVYDGIGPGSAIVIDRPSAPDESLRRVYARVSESSVVARADFGMSGKVTRLVLDSGWLGGGDTSLAAIRDAVIRTRGVALDLATEPVPDDVGGGSLELSELEVGLQSGRWIVVEGERTDIPGTTGVQAAELSMIAAVRQEVDAELPGDRVHTVLTLAADLAYTYRRDTVKVYGNVIPATQGAGRDEAIGSGDASATGQTFALFQAPLTWVAADTPSGAASTLEVRVNGVRWHEVDSFAGRGPLEPVYVTWLGPDGRIRIRFGDGVHGARLPTGSENVRAHYRVGAGASGNLLAQQITQLSTRPLGVSGVTNPLPATGGADADGAADIRRGIPLAVGALDRLVGVPDYAAFAAARAGIGRASAVQLFDGRREVVHVTISGAGGIPLADDSLPVTTLRSALVAFGDPQLPVAVAVAEETLLLIAVQLVIAPDYAFDLVEPQVRAALIDRFSPSARDLGQPAYLSEVLVTAQAVPGVDRVDVDVFTGIGSDLSPAELEAKLGHLDVPERVVTARPAEFVQSDDPPFRGIRPAQLVILAASVPDALIITEAQP
jgi:predicted phage baseplate assembly protein